LNLFLVRKQDIDGKEHLINERNHDSSSNLPTSAGSLSKVYFGELYWADTITKLKSSTESIPLEEMEEKEIVIDRRDACLSEEFQGKLP
jgi:hypothetical protein